MITDGDNGREGHGFRDALGIEGAAAALGTGYRPLSSSLCLVLKLFCHVKESSWVPLNSMTFFQC